MSKRTKIILGGAAALLVIGGISNAVSGAADTSTTPSAASTSASDTGTDVTPAPMPPISQEQKDANDAAKNAPAAPPVDKATTPPPATKPAPKPKPAPPAYTVAQENAIGAAKDYLDMSGFSRAGLIKQLSSSYGDGYSKADATFAVDHLNVDWKQQALRSAKDYLSMSHFSRSGLIEQLSSSYGDGYTKAQASYAADQVGL